ncbi:unnamed protein product [Fructobacillus cardui]|uniref:hypothetical protein n=1 Tax=Fructobacillus TaxID=559173 RepID=UPI00064D9B0E|nr:hypothetical protein [Fructobacillus sp. EFB-N1]KMK53006.1 hypothetical protein FEFB_11600 [Fructobacillus sp. EFB-N1]CAK1230545.1 unnamed protein product [Fructobacillus cardui]
MTLPKPAKAAINGLIWVIIVLTFQVLHWTSLPMQIVLIVILIVEMQALQALFTHLEKGKNRQ